LPLLHVLILAMVQGLTEFLPVSSSGHLVLTWELFDFAGWPVPEETGRQRLILDVAVHLGALGAVFVYFRRDVGALITGLLALPRDRDRPDARLALHLLVASLPLVIFGYLLKDLVTEVLRNPEVIAWATLGFGLLLYAGDRIGAVTRGVASLTMRGALAIGLSQVLALVPGTSRSGITMTAARFLGLERTEAARFSMLLAIPAILGATVLVGYDLLRLGDLRIGLDALVAIGLSFLVAWLAIAAMMAWLSRATFTPFVIYRVILGAALLWFVV
jgi:undecaprenyl-diphosphatase